MESLRLKTLAVALTITLYGCGEALQPAQNQEWFFIVAEGLDAETRHEVGQQLQELVGTTCVENDVVHFILAPSQKPLASMTVPAGSRNRRLRSQEINGELRKLIPYFTTETATGSQQINLPAVPATVRSLRRTQFPARVIIVGTPIYDDPQQGYWSMADGKVPTDASLEAPNCPFHMGVVDFPGGTIAEWFPPTSRFGVDHVHEEAITRYYRLFFQKHKAKLTRLTSNIAIALDGSASQFSDTLSPQQNAELMRTVRLQISERQPRQSNKPVLEEAEQVLAAAEEANHEMAFAINWVSEDPSCDIDVHVRSAGCPEVLFFGNTETPFGKFFRDVQSSGSINGDSANYQNWEWVRIDHGRLEDLTIWLNAYRTAEPAQVRIIGVSKGRRYERNIQINGPGDGGRSEDRELSDAWYKVTMRR
ncbi:MAG: hypothetical protein GXP26_13260 [Planctomycetes bacterium]|nr:hypothetical protein [Planctomycetota bacterium]